MRPEKIVMVPGLGGSGAGHWQTLWEQRYPAIRRVVQRDWEDPDLDAWLMPLEATVQDVGPDAVIVAHSLGVLLAVHWMRRYQRKVRAMMLVAAPDPDRPDTIAPVRRFAPVPQERLPCASIVVCSTNDHYADLAFHDQCTRAWGSRTVCIGAVGHINADSQLGFWEDGFILLDELCGK